jgi:hypothetical protein
VCVLWRCQNDEGAASTHKLEEGGLADDTFDFMIDSIEDEHSGDAPPGSWDQVEHNSGAHAAAQRRRPRWALTHARFAGTSTSGNGGEERQSVLASVFKM